MASGKRRRKESAPGWAWMLFGLSIGLSVALVVYLRSGSPSDPARADQTAAAPATQASTAPSAQPSAPLSTPPSTAPSTPPAAGQPAALASETPAPSGGESEEGDEPAYSFFDDLGKSEVIVDPDEFDFGSGAPRVVLIQAGAFRDIDDADARQASLALVGYESHIDSAIVAGDLWFRVLIGPLTERGEVNEAVRRLRGAGIETVLRTVTN